MKKLGLLAVLMSLLVSIDAQDGIQFNKGTWAEILADAKAEDKLIFVDAFTTWCGPCKWMAANAFPDKAVGEYFNSTFVNAKIDMEKGEGVAIAKAFEVKAYPTLLFVNGNGELIHRGVGGRDAEGLLELGKAAVDPNKQIGPMLTRFAGGDRDAEFLKNFVKAASEAYMPEAKEIAKAYFKTQDDLLTAENMELILEHVESEREEYFDFMVKNRAKFGKVLGKDRVNATIMNIMVGSYYRDSELDLDKVTKKLERVYSKKEAEQYAAAFKMMYYKYRARIPVAQAEYLKAAIAYMDKYGSSNWQELNEVAWSVYESTDDTNTLKKAVKWAKQSVRLDTNYYNMDTLAHIYHKLGKHKQAKKYAEKAIVMGKATGEDVSSTEKLLGKIV